MGISKFLGLTASNAGRTFANINFAVKEGIKNIAEYRADSDAPASPFDFPPEYYAESSRNAGRQLYILGQVMRESEKTSTRLNIKM